MSYAKLSSAQTQLLHGELVTIEVDLSRGLHSFGIVGLPDKAVEESKDRVSSAIKNSGFESPKSKNHKVVVSLSPADIKKEGGNFDLGIALAYLLANEDIKFDPTGKLFLGELTLSGDVRPVRGIISLAEKAKEMGITELFVPTANSREAALIQDIKVYGVETLRQIIDHLDENKKSDELKKIKPTPETIVKQEKINSLVEMQDIRGQESAKRGLEIAAAGGHNIAMYGPPGTGKTMLARAFASLLPDLTRDEILELTKIHSISGTLENDYVTKPSFRSPHHTASYVSIIGGGTFPKPGEVTLAHRGVLFLDEFPEFDKKVVESLRQPLEDNVVSISRAKGTAIFPSNFILVAAMNPCPCGFRGSKQKACICTPNDLARYTRKISGPIIDRIDLWVNVSPIEYEKLTNTNHKAVSGNEFRARINNARQIQSERFKKSIRPIRVNADMSARDLNHFVILKPEVKKILNDSAEKLQLSARAYHRIIKLARTIADLAESPEIEVSHVLEALQYRPKI